MAALAPDVRARAARLLRMLASPADGEVLNAARSLDRTLRGAGQDINDLADEIETGGQVVITEVVWRDRRTPDQQDAWRQTVQSCARRLSELTEREAKFVREMADHPWWTPSQSQTNWMAKIHDRLRKAAA